MFLDKLPVQVALLMAGNPFNEKVLGSWSKSLAKNKMKLLAVEPTDKPAKESCVYMADLSHREDEESILKQIAKFSSEKHRLIILTNGNTQHVIALVKSMQQSGIFPVGKNCHIELFPKPHKDFVGWLEEVLMNKPRPTPNFLRAAHL